MKSSSQVRRWGDLLYAQFRFVYALDGDRFVYSYYTGCEVKITYPDQNTKTAIPPPEIFFVLAKFLSIIINVGLH